ncbi:TlpA family protein disulfide reductase [Sphingobacterium sp. LRF_L2]|uniref:TlpA family protein disulfide reductase n=1 Tax=Sphingobacterium sp. LRF_L2 TaxID=3369421 RepID=UPI003F633AED
MTKRNKTLQIIIGIAVVALLIVLVLPVLRSKLKKPVEAKENKQEIVEKASVNPSFLNDKGDVLTIADLKGKVVFLNFWATWCPPCKAEMPSIQVLKDKFKGDDRVVFMLVEIEGESEKAKQFMEQGKMDLPIFYPDSEIPSTWLEQSIPTTIILDKEGNIAARHEGMADYARKEVFEFITTLTDK